MQYTAEASAAVRARRAITLFLAITYGLAIALSALVWFTGGRDSAFTQLAVLAMFFPAAAVLILRLALKEKLAPLGWRRFPAGYVLLALLLMPAVLHAVMLPLAAALEGGLPWQNWLTPQPDGLYHAPEERGWGTLTGGELIGRIALNAVVGLAVVSVLAFFEEIGWRAWLIPRLMVWMSAERAVVTSAVIWAFWHTPFALSGIHHIEAISPAMTALVLPIGHIGAGLVIGWLWLRTASIWTVMLAHGALNNWGQYAFKFMQGGGEHDAILLAAGNLALLALGTVLVLYGLSADMSADPDRALRHRSGQSREA